LTELAAIGNQNAYLNINPEVTLFKQCYRRPTNFAICEADIKFFGQAQLGQCLTCIVPRNGDLLGGLYFAAVWPALSVDPNWFPNDPAYQVYTQAQWDGFLLAGNTTNAEICVVSWTNAVGHAAIRESHFYIGGTCIDKLYDYYLQIWERYAGKAGKYLGEMIGQFDNVGDLRAWSSKRRATYTPLPYFQARHHDMSLPLIALQYHEVKLTVVLRTRDELVVGWCPDIGPMGGTDIPIPAASILDDNNGQLVDGAVTANYVFLDTAERRVQAQQSHEYLITQLQVSNHQSVAAGATSMNMQVHFNHPVLELFWFYQDTAQREYPFRRYFNFAVPDDIGFPWDPAGPVELMDPFATISLQVNSHDRISQRGAFYFRKVPAWERHSSIPTIFAYNYDFALYPEDDKPSGSINFSRIDNVVWNFTFATGTNGTNLVTGPGEVMVICRNWNVLKIAGGMGALRHAN
jgi:hypothetical protein